MRQFSNRNISKKYSKIKLSYLDYLFEWKKKKKRINLRYSIDYSINHDIDNRVTLPVSLFLVSRRTKKFLCRKLGLEGGLWKVTKRERERVSRVSRYRGLLWYGNGILSRDTIELFLSSELAISPSGIVERACSREKWGGGIRLNVFANIVTETTLWLMPRHDFQTEWNFLSVWCVVSRSAVKFI